MLIYIKPCLLEADYIFAYPLTILLDSLTNENDNQLFYRILYSSAFII